MCVGSGADLLTLANAFIPALATRADELARLAGVLTSLRDSGAFNAPESSYTVLSDDKLAGADPSPERGGDATATATQSTSVAEATSDAAPPMPAVMPDIIISPPIAPPSAPSVTQDAIPISSEISPGPSPSPTAADTHCYTCGTTKTVKWRKVQTPEGLFW